MHSGFVSVVGRPNVGKSTLINSIIGRKVAITSNKPQTTRNIIQGIYNDEDSQIVFVDTPGIHKPNSRLGKTLNNQAYYSIHDTDFVMFVVDSSGLGKGDEFVLEEIKKADKKVVLPTEGLDAMTIRFEFCQPPVILSSEGNPLGMPHSVFVSAILK